jgi:hypothetical protein
MFNHCGGDSFYAALYELAARTRSLIFWPAVPPGAVATDAAIIQDLSPDFAERLAPVEVVRNGRELAARIMAS